MQQPMKCWVCGRGAEEIHATLVIDDEGDAEFNKQLGQINWFRTKLTESAAAWRRALPRDFKDMDFNFVVSNPDQFKGFTVIGEMVDARSALMDWPARAAVALRKGDEGMLQDLKLAALKAEDRSAILNTLEQFENRYRRLFTKDESLGRADFPAGFEGISLGDGLEYLIAGGGLYYDIRTMLVQFARNEELSKRPRMSVDAIQLRGFGAVPICDVCRAVFAGLRGAPEEAVDRPQAEIVKPPPQPSHKPEPVAPKAVQPAPKKVRAQEQIEEVPAGASPGYLEIVKKLGAPKQGEEEPKMRSLHEHRMKEDWEEILEQQQQSGSS